MPARARTGPLGAALALGLNLGRVDDLRARACVARLTASTGMCSHRIDVTVDDLVPGALDADVVALLDLAAEHAA